MWLHTVNARPIVSLDLTNAAPSPLYPPVTSLAFLERDYSHTDVIATGAPDGTITLRTWNANSTPEGEKARWEFSTLKTLKVKSESRYRSETPCVTALRFVGCVLLLLILYKYPRSFLAITTIGNHYIMERTLVRCTDGSCLTRYWTFAAFSLSGCTRMYYYAHGSPHIYTTHTVVNELGTHSPTR